MYRIDNIGNEPKQIITWQNDDIEVELSFEYKDNQLGWFIGITYNDITYENIRLTTTANLLRSYSAYLPFGIMCITEDEQEPISINDFSSKYASIFILTKSECKDLEDNFYAKIST